METQKTKQQLLDDLYAPYQKCLQCPLGFLGRTNVVFGEGNPNTKILFVGEAPGREEDEQARPFVGRSGKLLNKALELAGIAREDIYITNIVKCRPPDNRKPLPIEITTCTNILLINQIKIIQPALICPLGSVALTTLLGSDYKITQARGTSIQKESFLILPVYHPSYVLRNQSLMPIFFQDIKAIKDQLIKLSLS
ncbi:uracil-DNA glycosylase [Candidatus Dependentiae bacterium]|nr:uracil-DNA glycosylase [Candidatus Dependentiae bacterium]